MHETKVKINESFKVFFFMSAWPHELLVNLPPHIAINFTVKENCVRNWRSSNYLSNQVTVYLAYELLTYACSYAYFRLDIRF